MSIVHDLASARAKKQARERTGRFLPATANPAEAMLTSVTDLNDRRRIRDLNGDLDRCTGLFDTPLSELARERILTLVAAPTEENWDDAHSILLNRTMTVWASLLEYTDYDVYAGPAVEIVEEGVPPFTENVYRQKSGWEKLPTKQQLLRAIRCAAEDQPDPLA